MVEEDKIFSRHFFCKKWRNEAVRLRPYGLRRDKQVFASVRECLSGFICRKIAKKPQLPHKKQPTATLGKYPSGSPDFHAACLCVVSSNFEEFPSAGHVV